MYRKPQTRRLIQITIPVTALWHDYDRGDDFMPIPTDRVAGSVSGE
jgi:hypothetical protein